MPINNYYKISNFNSLPAEPEYYITTYRGKERKNPNLCQIAGTVISKDKSAASVILLTQDGVVKVRVPKGKFSYYDKTLVIGDNKKKGWFEKGEWIIVTGFRRDEEFVNRKSRGSDHSIVRISAYNKELIQLESERG